MKWSYGIQNNIQTMFDFQLRWKINIHTEQSEFQRIDILEAKEFGKFFTLRRINDGNGKR